MPSLRTRAARKNAPSPPAPTRTTTSLRSQRTIQKPAPKSKANTPLLKKAIKAIIDFKIMEGTMFYLVQHKNTQEKVWIPAESIDTDDPVLEAFHEKVKASGYDIEGTPAVAATTGRPSRMSKTRAILRFQPTTNDQRSDSDSDRSVVHIKKSNKKKRTRAGGNAAPKKQKNALFRAAMAAQERAQRVSTRADYDDAAIVEMANPECCLRCKVRLYRDAVENDDVDELTAIIADKKNIPHWTCEECLYDSDYVVRDAVIKDNKVMVEMILNSTQLERVHIPEKYRTYGSDTGFISHHTFGHALKKVNESRGNRQGNSAFFRNIERDPLNVDIVYLTRSNIQAGILSAVLEGRVTDDMIELIQSINRRLTINQFLKGHAFYWCVASGNWLMAGTLVKMLDVGNAFNQLHIQVLNNKESKPLDTYRKIQILKRPKEAFNISPLCCAAIHPSRKFFVELYEALTPAEYTETDTFGRTVAHFAAASTTPDCLEYLIEQDFALAIGDKYKLTPLIQAARYGRHRNIRPLITYLSGGRYPSTEQADLTLLRNGIRALHYAAFNGHPETCRALIDAGATVDVKESTTKASPLAFAAQRGHIACVKVLVEHGGADVELTDKYQRTLLHLACMYGHYDVVKYLLFDVGLDADAKDTSSNHPIHYAAAFGHIRIVRLLVEGAGADPSASNIWRASACSVANMKGHLAIVEYLLTSCFIDPNFKDPEGRPFLHACAEESVDTKAEMDQVIVKSELLYSRKANPNLQTVDGYTVLHTLASIPTFKEHRAEGWTPEDFDMHRTPGWSSFGMMPSLRNAQNAKPKKSSDEDGIAFQKRLAEMAMDAGADLEITDNNNETPLATAMRHANFYMVELLVQRGANFWDVRDKDGNTFFHHMLKGAAILDSLPTHRTTDTEIKARRVAELERIWAAVLCCKTDQRTNINAVNREGYPAIVFGVKSAVDLQRTTVLAEKNYIKQFIQSSFTNFANASEPSERKDAVFEFRFEQWMNMAEKIIGRYHPDMNATIQLPKNFFKEKRKRDVSEYPTETGFNALHAAAKTQHARLLSFLLKHGCDGNHPVKINDEVAGDPPMLMSFFTKTFVDTEFMPEDNHQYRGYVEKAINVIKPEFELLLPSTINAYLEAGINPCAANSVGFSALMKASKELHAVTLADMCSAIVDHSYSGIDEPDESSKTALMYALDAIEVIPADKLESNPSSIRAVKLLLLAKADPNLQYQTDQGDNVLMRALRFGNPSLVHTLFTDTQHPIDHRATNNKLQTMAIIACSQSNAEVIKIYFDALAAAYAKSAFDVNVLDQEGNSALYLAARAGNEHAVSALLSCKADPNLAAGPIRRPPLSEAARGAFVSVAQTLLDAGAQVNAKDAKKMTALHWAVIKEKYPLVKLLLNRGADVHVKNHRQRTPLHFAVQQTKSMVNASLRVERLLIEAGADINARDILGRTPLHIAFIDIDVLPHMKALARTIKKVKAFTKESKAAEKIEKEAGRVVEKYGHPKATQTNAWIRAAVTRYREMLRRKKYQVEHGMEEDKENDIPLGAEELSLLETYAEMTWEFDRPSQHKADPIDIVNFLLQYPTLQCDVPDRFGRTPLHYAATVGGLSSSTMIFARGIDVNATDLDNNTPLQLSLLRKHVDYSVMLCNNGAIHGEMMTPPEGGRISTLRYSLAQDFMNMAYVILGKRTNVLEFLHDALGTGKFHVADILMGGTDNARLKETLYGSNQNLWHVLANFTPFDREIWEDYLQDFINKAHQLDVTPHADSHRRTAVHYAAKHGQDSLLKHLLHMGVPVNVLDEDGVSELWYAVDSGRVSTVKILLEAGVDITRGTSTEEKGSVLLKATANRNLDMVKLLIGAHAPVDQDSLHGRPNAVMQASVDGSYDILKILLENGADPNVPSLAVYKLQNEEKRAVIHPVFIASGDLFKALMEAGANVNVVSPPVKPWEGKSCFMSRTKPEELRIMLNKNVDVNLKDDHSPRTIFYHYYFSRRDLPDVLDHMLKNTMPNVNEIDPTTGMTPLEHAIREHNNSDVEHLLRLGADPNVTSNRKKIGKDAPVDLFFNGPVSAIFHAVSRNDLVILRTLCTNSKVPINWTAVDYRRRTVLTFIASQVYAYDNLEIVNYIISSMGSDFVAISEMTDNQGKRAIDYASERSRKGLHFALVGNGASASLTTPDSEEVNISGYEMDIESSITMQMVEKDADKERASIEKKIKKKKKGKKVGEEDTIDPLSGLGKIGRLVYDELGRPYDIKLQKIEVTSSYYGRNMFYKLSLIHNPVIDVYVLWTRWGGQNEHGMHQKTPFLSKEEAVAEFHAVFRNKTGNVWEDHTPDKFISKPGRFELIRALPKIQQEVLTEFDFISNSAKSELPLALGITMELFCNLEALQEAYTKLNLNIPVGRIPQASVDEGERIIEQMFKLTSDPLFTGSSSYNKHSRARRYEMCLQLGQLNSQYFRLFPPTDLNRIVSLFYSEQITVEQARLNNIGYLCFSSNVILAAKHRAQEIHPLDYCYRALNCGLNEIMAESSEYNLIKKYMISTAESGSFEIAHLFSVNRAGEAERFAKSIGRENRKLLWHGSHTHNFLGIMKQGLRVNPDTSSQHSGAMYGNGIYFADMFTKSINYSRNGSYETKHPGYNMLLLCEVALGNVQEMGRYAPYEYDKDLYHSVKGRGKRGPAKDNALYDLQGVEIPMGPGVEYQYSADLGYRDSPQLNYNEYVVYNESQVKIRYLVAVRDTSFCSLCQTNRSTNIKPLVDQKLNDPFTYTSLSKYESKVLDFYFTNENRSLQEVFKENMDGYLASEQYRKRWSPAEPLEWSTRVCTSCTTELATFILVQAAADKLPPAIRDRPICRHGAGCKNKSNLTHAKKYQHWYHPEMSKASQQETDSEDEEMNDDDDETDDNSSVDE